MIEIDVVIISFAKGPELKKLTCDTVDTLLASEQSIKFNPIIIESHRSSTYPHYPNATVIYPNIPFGYHRYLNIGIAAGKAPFVCLCNNDLLFKPGWATRMIEAMQRDPKLMSTSPYSTKPHTTIFKIPKNNQIDYGYKVRRHVTGWCIFQKREIYSKIGKLDERFEFWYADNDYSETIRRKGIKHALVRNSIVEHVESKTLKSKPSDVQHALTRAQLKIFENKWK